MAAHVTVAWWPFLTRCKALCRKGMYSAQCRGWNRREGLHTGYSGDFFFLHRTKSLLFNYCHISNHIQNKSQNDNVQIKAPRKMKALVHCNSVTCHSHSAPWFTKQLPHHLTSLNAILTTTLASVLAARSSKLLDTRKTQGWDTARESAMTGDKWLLP